MAYTNSLNSPLRSVVCAIALKNSASTHCHSSTSCAATTFLPCGCLLAALNSSYTRLHASNTTASEEAW